MAIFRRVRSRPLLSCIEIETTQTPCLQKSKSTSIDSKICHILIHKKSRNSANKNWQNVQEHCKVRAPVKMYEETTNSKIFKGGLLGSTFK